MRILVGCERSGQVRRALRAVGHDAWSCDLIAADDGSPYHVQSDVLTILAEGWDAMIAFPECTYLCGSGIHWNNRRRGWERTEQAIGFVLKLADAPIGQIAIENPIGILSTRWRKPDQIIQPYEFGDDASKKTCLWLKGLPLLVPTRRVAGRIVNGRERWSNQTDSGQNKLPPSVRRAAMRSETYPGIARAFASQWFSGPTQ